MNRFKPISAENRTTLHYSKRKTMQRMDSDIRTTE